MATRKITKTAPLPDYVYPLGVPFQVQLVPEIEDECAGETILSHRIIRIADTQDTRRRWTTLLHEYLHATLDVVGASSVISDELEECIVQSLEHSLEQFLLRHGTEIVGALDVQK